MPRIADSILPILSLIDRQAPKAGLTAPKPPQPRVDFVDIDASSSVQSSCVGAAEWKASILVLAEHVRDRWSRVSSQKQRHKGHSAHHVLRWSHAQTGCWGWFVLVQLDSPQVFHRPLNWQVKLFKGTEENQGAFNIFRARFVGSVFRQPPILRTQNTCEEELGTSIPTVLQGNIVVIILNAVRKRRDQNNGILHTAILLIRVCRNSLFDI